MNTNIANLIIILIVLVIVGAIVLYLYKEKKRGVTCVGCPYAKQCGGGTKHSSSCSSHSDSGCSCGISADEILAQLKAGSEPHMYDVKSEI